MNDTELAAREAARFAVRRARRLYGLVGAETQDLEQEAWIAALRAAEDWRPDKGTKLRNWMIQCALWRLLDRVSVWHLERQQQTDSLDDDWAEYAYPDEQDPLSARAVEDRLGVQQAIEAAPLTPEERVVVFGRYWNQYTLRTIGIGLGVTESRASRIETAALAKIRLFLDPQYDEQIAALMRERMAA